MKYELNKVLNKWYSRPKFWPSQSPCSHGIMIQVPEVMTVAAFYGSRSHNLLPSLSTNKINGEVKSHGHLRSLLRDPLILGPDLYVGLTCCVNLFCDCSIITYHCDIQQSMVNQTMV